jgi:uncharacterized protein YbjT (DUF2867 family)
MSLSVSAMCSSGRPRCTGYMTEYNQAQHKTLTGKTLVIGGRGKTGRRVAQRLHDLGMEVRIGSRVAEVPFDWEEQATWPAAVDDVESAYVTFYPDLVSGSAEQIGRFARLAADSGVSRLVFLSGRGEPEAQRAEQAVRDSFGRPTIVRSSWFAQNFSESFLLEPVQRGVIALPAGAVAEPFVDAEDIADVAVAALTDDRHQGQLYEVTGPRLLTFGDVAEEISNATGREVRYSPVTAPQFATALLDEHVPEEFVRLMVELFTVTLDGRNAYLTDGVRRALGREPRDFTDYAKDTAASGIWDRRPAGVAEALP